MVVYEDGGTEAVKIYDRGVEYKDPETFGEPWHLSIPHTGNILAPRLSSEEPLGMQVADFVRTIRTRELPEHALTLARDVVRLAAAAAASLENGGELIALGPEIRVPEVV